MKKPIYIFDLDGTLANIDHRVPILRDTELEDGTRWQHFYEACPSDTLIQPVATLFNALSGYRTWIWTGRGEEVRGLTCDWLYNKGLYEEYNTALRMRATGDHRTDAMIKEEWLLSLSEDDRRDLVCVFDDRDSVVDMWRSHGITCMQVASGAF